MRREASLRLACNPFTAREADGGHMYKVVIVEDEKVCADLLKDYLHRFETENRTGFTVVWYKDGEEFITGYKSDADIIFMDIQMPFMDGYMASERLRKTDGKVKLVFVTNMAQYAIKGYSVEASDFIVKPINYVMFEAIMKRLLRQIGAEEKDEVIVLHTATSVERVSIKDILYIEVMNHTLLYHTVYKDVELFGSLRECERQLAGYDFARCAGSFFVNLKYVTSYDSDCVTVAERFRLPIGRSKRKEFLDQMNAYLLKES